MPQIDGSASILSSQANYQADDWGKASGSAELDFKATAELRRGVDLELGAQALVALDGSVSKFLAIDLKGQANAAARVQAQVQVPLDLFDEAGLAIRLQAVAEAAVGIQLGLGLNVGDFLALAGQDPRLKGIAMRLLTALLSEAKIEGGVLAKAAAAAMAYANVACTGNLIPAAGASAGFTIAAEAGVGLKAGAGFRAFAEFGIDQPQRLIRKIVDAVVEETLTSIQQAISDKTAQSVVDELSAPAKMALRACFEVGAELARGGGQFDPAKGPVLAQRSVAVFLEEAQRYVLERLTQLALDLYKEGLRALGFAENTWDASASQRHALAEKLRNIPDDPFEPNQSNKDYWSDVLAKSADLGVALGSQNRAGEPWLEALSMVWSATQLLYQTVERVSDTEARASFLGKPVTASIPAFTGPPAVSPPAKIAETINATLRPNGPAQALSQADLVAYLLRASVLGKLMDRCPAVHVVVNIIGGPNADPVAVLTGIFNNIGAFVPAAAGGVDPKQSLQVIFDGLSDYVNQRVRDQFDGVVRPALVGLDPDIQLYLDDVLLDSLGFAINVVFSQVLDWAKGSPASQKALREACSAVVMKLCGRSLVVTGDVLLNKALAEVGAAFRAAIPELTQRGGVVDVLSGLVPILDKQTIQDAVEEIFDLAADTFQPLEDDQRARIRGLLYQVIDTAPAGSGANLTAQLQNDAFVPNVQAATDLALELGSLISKLFVRLIERVIDMLGRLALEAISDVVENVEKQIAAWVADIQEFLAGISNTLAQIEAEIANLSQQVQDAADHLLDQAQDFLDILGGNRATARNKATSVIRSACLGILHANPLYSNLPSSGRDLVNAALDEAIDALADNQVVNTMMTALGAIANQTATFLQDARAIDPNSDVAGELVELLADRVEDALRDTFGTQIVIPISFRVHGSYRGPRIDTPFGSYTPSVSIDVSMDLGHVAVKTNDLVAALRTLARDLEAVTSAARALGDALVACINLEQSLTSKEVQQQNLKAHENASRQRVEETRASGPVIQVLDPGNGAAYTGNVPVAIAFTGVPESFLGAAEGEIQRVYVFLNHAPFDLKRFTVTSGVPQRAADPVGRAAEGITVAHPIVAQRTQRLNAIDPNQSNATQLGSRTPIARGALVSIGSKTQSGSPTATTLGRLPSLSGKLSVLGETSPGLVLNGQLSPAELIDGFNTLTVVVTTGAADARVTSTVVFASSETATVSLTNPYLPVPARIPTPFKLDPKVLAPGLLSHITTAATPPPGPRKQSPTLRIAHTQQLTNGYARLLKGVSGQVKAANQIRSVVIPPNARGSQ